MKTYYARDYGIVPDAEVGAQLNVLLEKLAADDGEKTLLFDPGDYRVDAATCPKETLYVTNTSENSDWINGAEPHVCAVVFLLKSARDLTVKGNRARFTVSGKATNFVLLSCENVSIFDLEIRAFRPDMHEFVVERVGAFSADFRLDTESAYEKDKLGYTFVGQDYRTRFDDRAATSFWNCRISADNPDTVERVKHPFCGALSVSEISERLFRLKYLCASRFHKGERFCIYDNRRTNNGVFLDGCKNILLSGIAQRFNYGLALVAQTSENVTLENSDFSPDPSGVRNMASAADFLQFCMCKGTVTVKNNRFAGAGDDCLNVHGIHFYVKKIRGQELVVEFRHSQTYGFNPLTVGDVVEFIEPSTLEIKGASEILSSELLPDLHSLKITLSETDGLSAGDVIEDVTRCPNLLFENNTLTRIVTRGLLITTRGKAVVANNDFQNTTMHSILVSNDAKNWYESGRVIDLTVTKNHFGRCPQYTVCVLPENGANKNRVHSGIRITDNEIESEQGGFYFKNATGVVVRDNKFAGGKPVLINKNSEVSDK